MSRPVVIDGFCCAGGAARGYHDAGFDVIGVDIDPSPNYPYPCYRGDALEVIPRLVRNLRENHDRNVVVVHTSPPCQANIAITAGNRGRDGWTDGHVNLIPQTREMLAALWAEYGVSTVIENGESDQLRPDVKLCGLMFRLATFRHRYFELDQESCLAVSAPIHPTHRGHRTIGWRHGHLATAEPSDCPKCGEWHRGTVYGVYGDGGGKPSIVEAQIALGLHHTNVRKELNEAIPPAYTRHIGRQLMVHLESRAAA